MVTALLALIALVVADFRWLRVMQREHYIAGSCLTTAVRWARARPPNQVLAPVMVVAAIVALLGWLQSVASGAALLAAAGAAVFPVAMPLIGAEQGLVRTPRLVRLAASCLLLETLVAVAVLGLGKPAVLGTLAVLVPVVVDGGALITRPLEAGLARRYLVSARATLAQVGPRVIAVTGSFGKTSTKSHVRDLLSGIFDVVASPASWNNSAGLCRTATSTWARRLRCW